MDLYSTSPVEPSPP